jgi:hypothetical protein
MFILGVYNLSLRVKNNVFLAECNEVIVHVTIGVSIYSLSQKNRLCVPYKLCSERSPLDVTGGALVTAATDM